MHSDSRQIKQGDIFVACQGEYTDGRSYIPAAIANGATFVFWDDDGKFTWNPEWNVPNQGIKDLKHRAGMLAAQVYGNVSDGLKEGIETLLMAQRPALSGVPFKKCWGIAPSNRQSRKPLKTPTQPNVSSG